MTWQVHVRPEAEQDVAAARDWYEQRRAGLGGEFLDEFASAMRRLETDPERERFYYLRFRRILLQRFPFKIFYQVIDERCVVVFRVLRAARDHEARLR
jgi:plasmid stabilization system protein ParE